MPDTFTAQALPRLEDRRLLTGAGRYTGDIRPGGLAHAVILRSPHAHARIARLDVAAARRAPGVVGVFTAAELAADGIPDLPGGVDLPRPDGGKAPKTHRPILAKERVRFVGEAVALIVAETALAAAEATELIEVEYDALPAVANSATALAAGAPKLWDELPDNIAFLWKKGDAASVEAAFAAAAHVTRLESKVSRVTANSLEPRGATAVPEADGRLTLYTSHQSPYGLRNGLAGLLNIAPDRLVVVAGDVGGSFGMKAGVHPEPVLVLFAARKLKRPVRWIADRTEGFQTDEQARDVAVKAELALDGDGNFLAVRFRYDIDIGAYLSGRSLAPINNIRHSRCGT